MRPGIKMLEETVGTGPEATRDKTVVVEARVMPASGDGAEPQWERYKVNLRRRDYGPALQYGVEGMKAGGRRLYTASASLMRTGEPAQFEVKLIEVRDGPQMKPEEYPPGRTLSLVHPGELSRALSRWNITLHEGGGYHVSLTPAVPGMRKWKHSRPKFRPGQLAPEEAKAIIDWMVRFREKHPDEVAANIHTWGGDSSFYLDHDKKIVCLAVSVVERGHGEAFYVPETSTSWFGSDIGKRIETLLTFP